MRQGAPAMISEREWPSLVARREASGDTIPPAIRPGPTMPDVLLLLPGPYAERTSRILPFGGSPFPLEDSDDVGR